MSALISLAREQIIHFNLIYRLSIYEIKSQYQMHYLGSIWQLLNPLVLVGVYWFVFGIGIRGGSPIGETPFPLWLITGLIPWLYISPTVVQASNSIHTKIAMVSKMNFPVSVLPTIKIVSNSLSFYIMLAITFCITLIYDNFSSVYLLQLPYYLICMYILIYALTILTSSLATIIRDVQNIVQAVMRLMFFLLPIVWNVEELPELLMTILKLNPFYYLIDGFRHTLIGGEWFFEDLTYTIYFWILTIIILLIGSTIHLKFRNKFVDYL